MERVQVHKRNYAYEGTHDVLYPFHHGHDYDSDYMHVSCDSDSDCVWDKQVGSEYRSVSNNVYVVSHSRDDWDTWCEPWLE